MHRAHCYKRFWRILLYVTDDTIAKLYVTYKQMEGNGRKLRQAIESSAIFCNSA